MTIWESIFLGALQGLAEFLPISSSGHLILAGKLWDIGNNLAFDVFLHFGTLVSVLVVMRSAVFSLFKRVNRKKLLMLVLASLPTFAIAFVVKLLVSEGLLSSLLPIGFALTAVLLVLTHYCGNGNKALGSNYLPPLLSGVVQGIAVLPGLSRSGSTIAALSLCGVNREEAVEFSFLLSIPVITASAVVEGYGLITTPLSVPWYCLLIGVVTAFFVGCFAIRLTKRLALNRGLIYFALYLIIPLVLSLLVI